VSGARQPTLAALAAVVPAAGLALVLAIAAGRVQGVRVAAAEAEARMAAALWEQEGGGADAVAATSASTEKIESLAGLLPPDGSQRPSGYARAMSTSHDDDRGRGPSGPQVAANQSGRHGSIGSAS